MELTFIFFDFNAVTITDMRYMLESIPNSHFYHRKVQDLLNDNLKIDVIVSPSNSFVGMEGGIDKILNGKEVFKDIREIVRAKMATLADTDNKKILKVTKNDITHKKVINKYVGDLYLPVGKCLLVETENELCPFLASAPTMINPGTTISGTENVYHSFKAVLTEIYKNFRNNETCVLACSGLGTNVGGMTGVDSGKQMYKAYIDFMEEKGKKGKKEEE